MRPSIRNYFERKKKAVDGDNENVPLARNGIRRSRKTKHVSVNRLLRKCKEHYQRKTPEQVERIRQEARKVYYLRKLESIVPPATFQAMTAEDWSQTAEERKQKRLEKLKRENIRQRRTSRLTNFILPKRRLPRALMNPEELEVAREKAREAQRRKRAGLTDEQREIERQKGRERMRQRRATMSEGEKQALREMGKLRMRFKRSLLNAEQREDLCKKERQRRRNKWVMLDPEQQEAQRRRRRERSHKKLASYTPEEREAHYEKHRQYDRRRRSRKSKKNPAPQKPKRPVDILSMLSATNAQLLVAEDAEPLPFASREHVNVPLASRTSSQPNDPLVEERTQLSFNSEQESTGDDEQVTENRSTEQSVQSDSDDLVMADQTCMPVLPATDEVRWQFKDDYCTSTTLQTSAGQ